MGKLLQIRVLAQSARADEVERAYPALCKLAWPQPRVAGAAHGVMELPSDLLEQLHHGDWSAEAKEALRGGVTRAAMLKAKLEASLADWKPRDADSMSYELEDTLDELEKAAAAL